MTCLSIQCLQLSFIRFQNSIWRLFDSIKCNIL